MHAQVHCVLEGVQCLEESFHSFYSTGCLILHSHLHCLLRQCCGGEPSVLYCCKWAHVGHCAKVAGGGRYQGATGPATVRSSNGSGCEAGSRPEELQPTQLEQQSCTSGLQQHEVDQMQPSRSGVVQTVYRPRQASLLLQMDSSGLAAPAIVLAQDPLVTQQNRVQPLQRRCGLHSHALMDDRGQASAACTCTGTKFVKGQPLHTEEPPKAGCCCLEDCMLCVGLRHHHPAKQQSDFCLPQKR